MRNENSAWIQTFAGRRFFVLDPRPEDVDILDIAHALAMITRFTGHTREFYSVAQHSVLVSRVCKNALPGLLHDGSEAYISDISSPLKHARDMDYYRTVERRVQTAVMEHFGLAPEESDDVKEADRRLLVTEKRDLMLSSPDWAAFIGVEPLPEKIIPWTARRAEREFLERFAELTGTREMAIIRVDAPFFSPQLRIRDRAQLTWRDDATGCA